MIGDPNAATTLRGLWAPPLDGTDGENKELLEGLEPLRGKLAWALAKLGAITSNELIAFVSSEPAHRRLGYLALAAEGSAASLRHLALRAQMPARNSTKDNKRNQTNRDSRLLAAEALGTSQESDALEHLLMLAKVDNGALQQACLRALRDQQTAASRLKLLELTIEAAGESFDRGCEYLGKLNVRAAAPALIAALSKSQSEELLEALGHLGGADARRALRVISNKVPPAMKRKAAQALARAGDTSLMPRLIKETLRSVQSNNSTGNVTRYLNRLGIDYLYAAEWPDAILAFRRMTWVDPTTINAAYNRACIAAMRGRKERALSFLRRSLDYNIASWSTASQWRHFETDPDLHSLHDDPRFKRLMARLKRRYYLERR